MNEKFIQIKQDIAAYLPDNLVVPRHTDNAHFYEVDLVVEAAVRRLRNVEPYELFPRETANPVYPSVTGKLQILKDESLINFKMNRALDSFSDYVFTYFKEFTDANILEFIDKGREAAVRAPASVVEDAGDIGTKIHGYRENYFRDWIKTGVRPADILTYIPEDEYDLRAVSALRALNKFLNETYYTPIACELLVYHHGLKVSGTLDDLGIMHKVMREGFSGAHQHDLIEDSKGIIRCVNCDYKARWQFVLMDLKTSNQFKDHYFFQVALYYWMFHQLTGHRPQRCFILKVSKEDGRYKIEDLYKPSTLASFARSMVRTHKGVTSIKSIRSDNQKTVIKI